MRESQEEHYRRTEVDSAYDRFEAALELLGGGDDDEDDDEDDHEDENENENENENDAADHDARRQEREDAAARDLAQLQREARAARREEGVSALLILLSIRARAEAFDPSTFAAGQRRELSDFLDKVDETAGMLAKGLGELGVDLEEWFELELDRWVLLRETIQRATSSRQDAAPDRDPDRASIDALAADLRSGAIHWKGRLAKLHGVPAAPNVSSLAKRKIQADPAASRLLAEAVNALKNATERRDVDALTSLRERTMRGRGPARAESELLANEIIYGAALRLEHQMVKSVSEQTTEAVELVDALQAFYDDPARGHRLEAFSRNHPSIADALSEAAWAASSVLLNRRAES